MHDNELNQYQEQQPIDGLGVLEEEVVGILAQFAVFVEKFNQFYQTRHFGQLVDFREPTHFYDCVCFLGLGTVIIFVEPGQDQVERNDRNEVHQEPSLQVLLRNELPVVNDFNFGHQGGGKNDKNVD